MEVYKVLILCFKVKIFEEIFLLDILKLLKNINCLKTFLLKFHKKFQLKKYIKFLKKQKNYSYILMERK